MKDLGEVKYYLGLRVVRDKAANTIKLHQEQYIGEVLEPCGIQIVME